MQEIESAIAVLPVEGVAGKPITVIGTRPIREQFDETCLTQAVNSRQAPGVTDIVLNPDAHLGFGAPVGCVLVSPTHVYPGPVGVDIKCSMSLLQLDLPESEIQDRQVRRQLITAIAQRIPTGVGRAEREAPKSRRAGPATKRAVIEGASPGVCEALGIPPQWAERCEDSHHLGHDGTSTALAARLEQVAGEFGEKRLITTFRQLGSYGGGNHFGECEVVRVASDARALDIAAQFGLVD
ncbi:MAG TPA: RtcB family protein, partial [bacterium]|nr:RtcB family protein [bacterium]